MFCYQCEQTARCQGCTVAGVCGKDEETAVLQDLLVQMAKQVGAVVHASGKRDPEADQYLLDALFVSVTNVSFDPERIAEEIRRGRAILDRLGAPTCEGCCDLSSVDTMAEAGKAFAIDKRKEEFGDTVAGLQELVLYGLKGAAAYAHHARELGQQCDRLDGKFVEKMAFLAGNPADVGELLGAALDVGKINYDAMELLDKANTGTYGKPTPTSVRVTPVAGKCILVSGHDLKDLALLLEQTEGKGVNVYTHGEMLPTLAYPELRKYSHLVGNYGGAWQDQQKEFEAFPGPILMTTNCIQKPKETYQARIFTTGLVSWPGVSHVDGSKDFTPVIEAALAAEGFAEDAPEQTIMVGFGGDAVLSVADKVVHAVKHGDIRHFFLVGGCDGAKPGRNYYTDFAQAVPDDCVILTLACGKFRFNKLDFGDIGGIPRLLDIGQCNDAYSAIRIAGALAEAFKCDVNDLPLSMILSWYEQKAVAILLTLLYLGIKNIKLGPSLPAFVTPEALDVLVEKFAIAPVTTPEEDLAAILG